MKYITELNQRFGEEIRDNVVKDIARGRTIGPSKVRRIATFFAISIMITPYCVAGLGVAIVFFNLDSIPAIVIGTLILAAGYFLRTPRRRNTQKTLRCADAPTLFSLLDDMAKLLGAPKIDGIHVNGEFNAYMAQFGKKERVLGIGAPLWLALETPERLALLAHEVAHLINQDPARSRLAYRALGTLSRWHDLSHPPAIVDHETNTSFYYEERGLLGQLFGSLFGGAIATIALGFEKLIFADSQRAEYLADVASASVAGVDAGYASLKKVILSPLAEDALKHTHFDGTKDISLFEDMARAVRIPDANRATELYTEATKSMHAVDSSHPPTRYRMEVVAAAGSSSPALKSDTVDWTAIDEELAPHFRGEEQALLSEIIIQ